jgi:type I restriction enzyme S subunit
MHQYKKYPKYKESGVAWLGEIPEDWISIKFKQVLEEKKKKTNLSLNCGSISFGTVVYKDNEKVSEETKASYQEVLKGEFLINPLNLNFDLKSLRTALSTLDVVVSTGYIVLKHKSNVNPYYLRWLLHQFDVAHMKTLGAGVRQTVNFTDIGNEYFYMPPRQEQQTIANYLDNATAKIDTLVAKQERLIELLKEKRQALISHAVTKGLNPNVKMKESGVEWLGEIPEHWEVSKLRFTFSFTKGLTITKANLQDEGIPCVNYGEIHSKYGFEIVAERDKLKCVDEEYLNNSKISLLSKGDFVFADTSEDIEGAGNFTQLTGETQIFAGYHTIIARQKNSKKNFRFFAYLFDSIAFRTQIRLAVKGVKVFSITQFILKDSTIWLPDMIEQQQIAQYLDEKTSKIDTLITKATKAIELLKERRTALICAVVTGKIDVREGQ